LQINYRASLIEAHTDMGYTSVSIQNKKTIAYLKTMEDYHNSGVIRYFSFGLFSIMWVDNYDKHLGLFEAQCDYLKPTYLEILQKRIVDVGFMNRWWLLKKNMKDFDVNDEEWVSSADTQSLAVVRE
jgi:Translocase of the Inner Mitochondrial membrane 29